MSPVRKGASSALPAHLIVGLPLSLQDNLHMMHVKWDFPAYKLNKGICVNLYKILITVNFFLTYKNN